MFETFRKAVGAGLLIGIGATVFLSCDSKIAGALFFCVGLFAICAFGLNLFTGKIGYSISNKDHPNCEVIWLGNLVGCILCCLPVRLAKPALAEKALLLVLPKLDQQIWQTVVLGIFCGVLMYVAVDNYKNFQGDFGKVIGIILGVSVFILCGFEHSIADMCYCIYAVDSVETALRSLLFLVIVTVSNGAGSLLFRYLVQGRAKKS